ncbi:MAG: SGNH/GDSL hydrolase family protein [Rhodobacteraceae bacterium]|nr:SGNH/GDSL hydrolase family protein [Paracoccaceae bacterium]
MPRPQRRSAPWPVRWTGHAPRMMAAPPATAIGTVATLPRRWPIGSGSQFHQVASYQIGGMYSISRSIPIAGPAGHSLVLEKTVTQNREGTRAPAGAMISFFHDGAVLELLFHSTQDGFLLKVDDEYVSLDPLGAAGTYNFFRFDFATRALRRIDIIVFKASFVEARTGATDALWAAPVRGPRTICVGDSFTTATPTGWSNWFAEAMGWDDVWTSGVGASGYLGDAEGLRIPFNERMESDVVAYRPEVVFIHGSVNDGGEDPSAVEAAAFHAVSTIRRHLPECLVAGGANTAFGAEYWISGARDVVDATRAGFEAAGGHWMSTYEMPIRWSGETNGARATLLDAVVEGQAGNTGTPTQVDGHTGFRINSDSADAATKLRVGATVEIGIGATRERAVLTATSAVGGKQVFGFAGSFKYAHAIGEPVREVGPSPLTGMGNSVYPTAWGSADYYVGGDLYHPNTAGLMSIGQANAAMLKQLLLDLGLS